MVLAHSNPLKYGHLSITDSSFGPRNDKNHTIPTSIIWTPLKSRHLVLSLWDCLTSNRVMPFPHGKFNDVDKNQPIT